jgi:hypothetical protein
VAFCARAFHCANTCIYKYTRAQQKKCLRNYEYCATPLFTVKTGQKKIPRNFRLEMEIHEELQRRAAATGIPETRIVEDALRDYFGAAMRKRLEKVASRLKGFPVNPNQPLIPFNCNVMLTPVS